jgi:hypothetical protein
MNLSNGEEQLMNIIWLKGKAFMKDLLEGFPEPKPAVTTVATLLKRLSDKGAIGYTVYGNSREYFPLIQKKAYLSSKVNVLKFSPKPVVKPKYCLKIGNLYSNKFKLKDEDCGMLFFHSSARPVVIIPKSIPPHCPLYIF